jgi:hypothetical protein
VGNAYEIEVNTHNGDGLCYINEKNNEVDGIYVNKVEKRLGFTQMY